MNALRATLRGPAVLLFLLLGMAHPTGSGPVGLYGIVEKVVFEPSEASPDRLQVWGVFALVDGGTSGALATSSPKRGYLYFTVPTDLAYLNGSTLEAIRNEWKDLKSVAGTGQAIGFGAWGYIGGFRSLQMDRTSSHPPYILALRPNGGFPIDLRVRPESEAPATPAIYATNAGIVKLSDQGSHAAIVKQLREGLKR